MTQAEGNRRQMDDLETSISDLQDSVQVSNDPAKNHFKPGWFLTAIIVGLIVGSATFFAVNRFRQVEVNSQTIDQKCQFSNDQVQVINAKLNQLNLLISAALRDSDGTTSPEVLAAFEVLRQPIPLKPCK